MESQPIRDERILEAIEACRPGSDDVAEPALSYLAAALAADPELENLYERLQQVDAMLAAGFRDVPVPEGLQQRLMERLAAAWAQQVDSAEEEQVPEIAKATPATAVVSAPKRVSRRWLLAGGGFAVGSAAALLVAVAIGLFDSDGYDQQKVLDEAIQFCKSETLLPGHPLAEKTPPEDYPLSRAVARVRGVQWRSIRNFLGCKGVAYDMWVGGTQATLYVVNQPVELPKRPLLTPTRATGGYAASAWMEGGRLYVLVVRGNANAYSGFLAPRGPLT